MKINLFLLLILFSVILFCGSCKKGNIDHSYLGFWAETQYTYSFYPNNEFLFTCRGHFGDCFVKGKYAKIDSFLLLIPATDWDMHQGVLKTKFLYQENCIRDFDNNYYCGYRDSTNNRLEKAWTVQEKIEERLLEIPMIKEAIVEKSDSTMSYFDLPRFRYDGIIHINFEEFHQYILTKKNPNESLFSRRIWIQHMDFVVNIKTNSIYQHTMNHDSLSYVAPLFVDR